MTPSGLAWWKNYFPGFLHFILSAIADSLGKFRFDSDLGL
jgi:hypothetical protein